MVSSGLFAALSAVLTYFFFVAAGGLAILIWFYRRRFALWHEMGPQGRADTILHMSLIGVLLIAGYHRAHATYHFAFKYWPLSMNAPTATIIYLPLHLICMSGLLWWLCIELVGIENGGKAWATLMLSAAAIGFWIFYLF